jgi:hypothetical protein
VYDGDQIPVPAKDAPWHEVWRFALSYNAYDRQGGFDEVARIGNPSAKQWQPMDLVGVVRRVDPRLTCSNRS